MGGSGVVVNGGLLVNDPGRYIIGGAGGTSEPFDGGPGGDGVMLMNGTIDNNGFIGGGAGWIAIQFGQGGVGAYVEAGTLTTTGAIFGGAGAGGGSVQTGGIGGAGVVLTGGALTNLASANGTASLIEGGASGTGSTSSGAGGAGVYVNGGTVTNAGTISGGAGARAGGHRGASGSGHRQRQTGFQGLVRARLGRACGLYHPLRGCTGRA